MYVLLILSFGILLSLNLSPSLLSPVRCMHVLRYISISLHSHIYLLLLPFIGGDACNHLTHIVGTCDEVEEGETMMMEVDLRGEGRERTLHFFISGRQQKIYFYNLPSTVEFCVCNLLFLLVFIVHLSYIFSFSLLLSHHLSSSSLLLFSSVSSGRMSPLNLSH